MARGRVQGPRITARDRTRIRLSQGVVRRWVAKGVFVDIDVSPIYLQVADGVASWLAEVINEATPNAPDDPTTPGSRIREAGGYAVYAWGQQLRVAGGGQGGYRKPRTWRPKREGISGVAHFRSRLHHLHELGTKKMEARPYLGPARQALSDRLEGHIRAAGPGVFR